MLGAVGKGQPQSAVQSQAGSDGAVRLTFFALMLTLMLGGNTVEAPPHADEAYDAPPRLPADRKLSADSDAYRAARNLLPQRFIELQTTRFVVISDANRSWTRHQAELLERTYHQFERFTRRLQLRRMPLRHKLVCVLFERRDDYQRFARSHDSVTADWITGYYSPKQDRVVFYNLQSSTVTTRTRGAVEPTTAQMLALDRHVAPARPLSQPTETEIIRPTRRRDRRPAHSAPRGINDRSVKAATATTVHEAIHQLAFHTRVESPWIQNPLWISEGLATAFETDRPNEAFGPDHDYAPRREQFQKLMRQNQLLALRELVKYTRMPDDSDETVKVIYHQSYALVTWMNRFRKTQLRAYLKALRSEPPGRPTADRHLELFELAFGDVDRLERAWLRYELDRLDLDR